jgi:hypothetical protein
MGNAGNRFEIRSSKSETNPKHETQMTETLMHAGRSVLIIWVWIIRACFGFRVSDFGFPRLAASDFTRLCLKT